MGDTDFSSADPWGIPVEEVELEAPEETTTEPAEAEEIAAVEEVEPITPADEATAADASENAVEEAPSETVETEPDFEPEPPAAEAKTEVERDETISADEGEAPVAESELKALSIPEVTSVADEDEPGADEPPAWEPDEVPPETKARGFSQMLAAALSSIRREEPAEEGERPTQEPTTGVAEAAGEDVLDENPPWMIEDAASVSEVAPAEPELDPWAPAARQAAAEPAAEAPEPAQEPAEETPEPVEEPIAEAAEPVEEPADEETPEPVEEPAEELVAETVAEPHAADEATEIGEDADLEDLVASLEVAAAVEEISSDAETDLPETHPQVFSELEELSEPSEAEAEVPIEETATEEGEERIVAASPGVEWGSRWRETAQGWVESEDGRSTWRPIVATSDTVAQWDVDTYLGVVAGDVATESSGDPEAVVSEARAVAIQRMLDDAVARGAHAVVGTEVAVHEIGGSLVVTATGTAVTLQARD